MKKEPFDIDVAVLLIFFNRPGCFAKVFEQVRKARPSKLFLYQDGPRKNTDDKKGIEDCREIASNIDWECDVKTFFQEENFGCDPSEYIAQKWAFSHTDKCIILEDDDVPSISFFRFCKELLDKYENDQRINMICGMNNLEYTESPYSYFFTQTGSIWGWATWKRVIDEWNSDYGILSDDNSFTYLKDSLIEKGLFNEARYKVWKTNMNSGVEHYETINGLNQYSQHRLNIVPTYNMINNIGNSPEGSTHSAADISMIPKGLRRIYTMNRYEIDFPLNHPPYVIDNVKYQKDLFRLIGTGHPLVSYYRKIERAFLILKHEGVNALISKIIRTLRK